MTSPLAVEKESKGQAFALILNGDNEPRHLENVERAVAELHREGSFHISLLSPEKPKANVEAYAEASSSGLQALVAGLRSKVGPQSTLVLYVTGHGDKTPEGDACFGLKDTCFPAKKLSELLRPLQLRERVVVMDSCYAGAGLAWFADPNTTVVTQGSPGELVSCETFAPFFWSHQVPDRNGDGAISIQERYQFALEKGKTASLTQFYSTQPMSLGPHSPKAPFPKEMDQAAVVHNGAELDQQIKRLQPGQMALVLFSADWCRPCQEYLPSFQQLGKKYGGEFLLIHAEGIKGSEIEWAKRYGIDKYPSVAWMDHRGNLSLAKDRTDPLNSFVQATFSDEDERIKFHGTQLKDPDPKVRRQALDFLTETAEVAMKSYPFLWIAAQDPEKEIQDKAMLAIYKLAKLHPEIYEQVKKKFDERQAIDWILAGGILAEFAQEDRPLARHLITTLWPWAKQATTKDWEWSVIILGTLKEDLQEGEKEALLAHLEEQLHSPEKARRFRAAFQLSVDFERRPPRSFEIWRENLTEQDSGLVISALVEIERYFPKRAGELVAEILTALRHRDAKARYNAMDFVAAVQLKHPQILQQLRRGLKDPEWDLRLPAAVALYDLKAPNFDYRAQLKLFLQDKDPRLRFRAEGVLSALNLKEGLYPSPTGYPPGYPRLRGRDKFNLGLFSMGKYAGAMVGWQGALGVGQWGGELSLFLSALPTQENVYFAGGSLGLLYHFQKNPSARTWDPFLILPTAGFVKGLSGPETFFSTTPAGVGIQYHLSDSFSLGLQIRPRIDIPVGKETEGPVRLGFELPFGLAYSPPVEEFAEK
jgi:thiol-disulfide isomerase/thioredoxin